MKKKACIVGHFGLNKNLTNGQTIKTLNIYDGLVKKFGKNEILQIDTHNFKTNFLFIIIAAIVKSYKVDNVIILPAQRGIKFFVPLFLFLKKITKFKLHYVVIGGWLPELVENDSKIAKKLLQIDYIYVETKYMKNIMMSKNYNNVVQMPNFKNIKILSCKELKKNYSVPYSICTFSRVMKEKGIEEAVKVVKRINRKMGKTVYKLDIFGPIDSDQTIWFNELKKEFGNDINYKGIIKYDSTTETLKNYFALLFPTYYEGEGYAGTIIDAFSAGLPVVASDWKYNSEIIEDNITGKLFNTHDMVKFEEILIDLYNNSSNWIKLKKNCIDEANKYTSEKVLSVLYKNL